MKTWPEIEVTRVKSRSTYSAVRFESFVPDADKTARVEVTYCPRTISFEDVVQRYKPKSRAQIAALIENR